VINRRVIEVSDALAAEQAGRIRPEEFFLER